jgi:aromatic-L-amino-acid decarboxylase
LQFHIRKHVALAQEFAQWVVASEDFELAAPVPLNLVCLRHKGGDAVNEAILQQLNASGELYLTHTKLDGRYTLRMSIGQSHTDRTHVAHAWQMMRAAARAAVPV